MILVYCLITGLVSSLIMALATSAARNKIIGERDEYYESWQQEKTLRIAANVVISKLASEVEVYKEGADRYDLIRYYTENDHGTIAIEAFYGPQAIRSAHELDLILDEELDRRFIDSL